ncbi:hypothetical protein [Pseudooceanicola lipolyticus]|nr:hypothetical protein [Pseudooceanicola lipolyticus]
MFIKILKWLFSSEKRPTRKKSDPGWGDLIFAFLIVLIILNFLG